MKETEAKRKKEEANRDVQQRKELLETQQKRANELDVKEKKLKEDDSKAKSMVEVATELQKTAAEALNRAIEKNDSVAIKAAQEMITKANNKMVLANTHREEIITQRAKIGDKRKKQTTLMFTKFAKKN